MVCCRRVTDDGEVDSGRGRELRSEKGQQRKLANTGIANTKLLVTTKERERACAEGHGAFGQQPRFVSVSSGAYCVSVPLSDALHPVVRHTQRHVPGRGVRWSVATGCARWAVLHSVKWVERVAVTAEHEPSTGEMIARERLSRPR